MKFFSVFSFLFSFLTLFIVDPKDGGGSDDTKDGEGDGSGGSDDSSTGDGDSSGGSDDPKDGEESELQRLKRIVYENERIKAVTSVVSEIKSRLKDFDENKIRNYLLELKKTDPQKAEQFNNPVGWELIHLQHFADKEVDNDYFNHGRGGESVDRSAEIYARVKNGGVSRADEAIALRKLL